MRPRLAGFSALQKDLQSSPKGQRSQEAHQLFKDNPGWGLSGHPELMAWPTLCILPRCT